MDIWLWIAIAVIIGAVVALRVYRKPDPFDHDGDGKSGGSLPKSKRPK